MSELFQCIQPIIVQRISYTAGSYDSAGLWSDGSTITEDVEAIVTPSIWRMGSFQTMREQDGDRTRKWIELYSEPDTWTVVQEAEQIRADKVIYQGDTYEIRSLNAWQSDVINYDHALAMKLDERDSA